MKLEPMCFCEKTVGHYGKRGISWYGALARYFEFDDSDQQPAARDQKMYFDHISKEDAKQDRESVISLVEAALIRLRKDLPGIKRIVLLSDNASCYQNMPLPLVFPYLPHAHGTAVTRITHTKTQDGKSILDAHFARAMQVLVTWVVEGNNCITPTQAVIGLKCHGGLPNCVVELIEHDRKSLQLLVEQVEGMEKQLRRFVSRENEVEVLLSNPGRRVECAGDEGYKCCPDFELRVFEYSSIDAGVLIMRSPSRSSCCDRNRDREHRVGSDNTGDNGDEVRCQMGIDAESDVDESGGEGITTETVEVAVATGIVSGVRASTQCQLRRRTRRWRKQPQLQLSSPSSLITKGAVSHAVRVALEMRNTGKLFVQDSSGSCGICDRELLEQYVVPHHFPVGWARRLKRGHTYDQKHVADFREEIRDLFNRGEHDNARKMGPGRMLEVLRLNHPGRFDLPTESDIRQEISKLHKPGTSKPHLSYNANVPSAGSTSPKPHSSKIAD